MTIEDVKNIIAFYEMFMDKYPDSLRIALTNAEADFSEKNIEILKSELKKFNPLTTKAGAESMWRRIASDHAEEMTFSLGFGIKGA